MIDQQHREFFLEVEQVNQSLATGAGRDAVIAFYRTFVASLTQHFRDEEELLLRIRYPDYENHRAQHETLMAAVTAVEGMLLTSTDPDELQFIVRRLFAALVEHLIAQDMRYKTHVLTASGL